jgi:hypothetical protein
MLLTARALRASSMASARSAPTIHFTAERHDTPVGLHTNIRAIDVGRTHERRSHLRRDPTVRHVVDFGLHEARVRILDHERVVDRCHAARVDHEFAGSILGFLRVGLARERETLGYKKAALLLPLGETAFA